MRLALMMNKANYVIVFSGAGLSTDSGIPDFRSAGGIWRQIDPNLLSAAALRSDPARFFELFRRRMEVLEDKEPNPGHLAVAELSRLGVVRAVITQNIDGLHQKAGSKRVFEIHGNCHSACCLNCKLEYPYQLLKDQFIAGRQVPLSPCCQAVLRPNVVLFGDRMPPEFGLASQEAARSDLMLAIGTSLSVFPAAEIPLMARGFAVINQDSTGLDRHALLLLQAPLTSALTLLVESIKKLREK